MKRFFLPWWVWTTALALNVVLFFVNMENGRELSLSLNILCTTACLMGLLSNRSRR